MKNSYVYYIIGLIFIAVGVAISNPPLSLAVFGFGLIVIILIREALKDL